MGKTPKDPKDIPEHKRLPRGVGRVPKWWMEITPHDVFDIDDVTKVKVDDGECRGIKTCGWSAE